MDAVTWEQEDMEATIAVTKKNEPMYLREEALPSFFVGSKDSYMGADTDYGLHVTRNYYIQAGVSPVF